MTASRLYKYSFPDQLLVYAQRSTATAVASFDIWTKRMHRYVKKGTKGIALVSIHNGQPSLHYVFDVSDTGKKRDSFQVALWQYKEEYREVISKSLEERFGVSCSNGFPQQLEDVATKLSKDYWEDYHHEIMYELSESSLEGMDEWNVGVRFREVVGTSIAYALLSRCGFQPEKHFQLEDFCYLPDFNTTKLVQILGIAISQAVEQVLRQIHTAISAYECCKPAQQPYPNPHSAKPSIQQIYKQYQPVIRAVLLSDGTYREACKHGSREKAELEGKAAIKRAAFSGTELPYLRAYYRMEEVHDKLVREAIGETYPTLFAVEEHKNAGVQLNLSTSGTEGTAA